MNIIVTRYKEKFCLYYHLESKEFFRGVLISENNTSYFERGYPLAMEIQTYSEEIIFQGKCDSLEKECKKYQLRLVL